MARAVLTLLGPGSEYVLDQDVNREFLGHGAQGLPDANSGLLREGARFHSVNERELCIFKGEDWLDNKRQRACSPVSMLSGAPMAYDRRLT